MDASHIQSWSFLLSVTVNSHEKYFLKEEKEKGGRKGEKERESDPLPTVSRSGKEEKL